jgi:hypothetical protein
VGDSGVLFQLAIEGGVDRALLREWRGPFLWEGADLSSSSTNLALLFLLWALVEEQSAIGENFGSWEGGLQGWEGNGLNCMVFFFGSLMDLPKRGRAH